MRKIASFALSAVAVVAMSCGKDVVGPSDVDGEWRLMSLQKASSASVTIDEPARFTVQFGLDGHIGLRADCNVCGGTYRVESGSITTTALVCTRAYCGATAPLDTDFVALVEGAATLRLEGDRLRLSSERGTLVFGR